MHAPPKRAASRSAEPGFRAQRPSILAMAAAALLVLTHESRAAFHLWTVTEVYSSPDGSVQFVKLFTATPGQSFLSNQVISCTGPAGTRQFTFPTDLLSSNSTARKTLLIGTPALATVPGGVTPDFVLTNTTPFLFQAPGVTNTVGIVGSLDPSTQFGVYTNLPADGFDSLAGSGPNLTVATNSPKNFAGQSNSIVPVAFSASQMAGTNFVATFRTATGTNGSTGPNYSVDYSDFLPPQTWTLFFTVIGDGTSKSVTNALSSSNSRFYRLHSP